jgi:hypothetical protein
MFKFIFFKFHLGHEEDMSVCLLWHFLLDITFMFRLTQVSGMFCLLSYYVFNIRATSCQVGHPVL